MVDNNYITYTQVSIYMSITKRRHLRGSADVLSLRASPTRHLGQHPHDVFLDGPDVGFDLLKRAGRGIELTPGDRHVNHLVT